MTNAWLHGLLGNRITTKQRVAFHFCAWTIYIGYEILSIYFAYKRVGYWPDYVIFYGLNVSLFYVNVSVLTRVLKGPQKLVRVTLSLLALMVVYLLIKYTIDYCLSRLRETEGIGADTLSSYLAVNLWRGIFFLIASSFYVAIGWIITFREVAIKERNLTLASEMARTKLVNQLMVSRNAYLQQQINPHFLFNSLTLIYNSFHKHSKEAASCVSKLSDILRYCYKPAYLESKAPLKEELHHINQLIDLNRLRFNHPLYIDVILPYTDESETSLYIIPLILLTLTENIFQHGNLKDPHNPAKLFIHVDKDGLLKFNSRNLKRKWKSIDSSGIGLENTKKRLDHTYNINYQLTVVEENEFFEVELQLHL